MKKQLLLLAFSALTLTSCEDDDIQGYEMDMMKGEWKISKKEVISGKDNKTVISTETYTGCSAKNTVEYRTDYFTSYSEYGGIGTDCQLASKMEGKYTYDTETKKLVTKYVNDNERPYQVLILTSSEMRVMQLFDIVDQDGDMVPDYYYITYKR